MGLDVPELDDRSFEELLTDARKRIPVHSDSWTDHNLSDPGITMLELLVWVAESDIYQLDRVTDRHVRKYLRLLGVRPRKPQAARVTLSLDPSAPASGTALPTGTEFSVDEAGTTHRFRTVRPLTLTRADVAAVISAPPEGRVDNTRANRTAGLHFLAFGTEAARDSTVHVGFDADPFRGSDRLDLYVDFHEADLPPPASHDGEPVRFEPSVQVVWEHCSDVNRFAEADAWAPVASDRNGTGAGNESDGTTDGVRDGTNHLYHGGTVSIPKPDGWMGEDRAAFDLGEPLFWLRARVDEPGHEVPPQLNAFETGVVEVIHRSRYHDERLVRVTEGMSAEAAREHWAEAAGTTTARPGQEFVFPRAPVLDAEVTVGGTEWRRVHDFDASGPDDQAYVLEAERGIVRFGDGVRGEVPEPGRPVRATWYDHGGGTDGNVGGGGDWRFVEAPVAPVRVTPRGPATGGADAESTADALARLRADLGRPTRAVTGDDYRSIATHTPGLRFGRAAVHVEPHGAGTDDCPRSGVVTVAAVPFSPPHRDRPVASPGFREAVACHLDRHRLLTDEVVVTSPAYVGVHVRADVKIADGHAADHTARAVERAIERFLDPLEGYDGEGWPFGRPVYRSEVYQTIEGVASVDCVNDVDLNAGAPGTRGESGIDLPPTGLTYLDDVTVTTEAPGDRHGRWSR